MVTWCYESKWPLSVLLTELKYISNTLETSVEKLECALHLQFISSLEKITLYPLALLPLTGPCYIPPNHCLPPLVCVASDLSVSSPHSGFCLTCCYFPFHFYSLLWCLHPPLVHLWYMCLLCLLLYKTFFHVQQNCFSILIQKTITHLCNVSKILIAGRWGAPTILLQMCSLVDSSCCCSHVPERPPIFSFCKKSVGVGCNACVHRIINTRGNNGRYMT